MTDELAPLLECRRALGYAAPGQGACPEFDRFWRSLDETGRRNVRKHVARGYWIPNPDVAFDPRESRLFGAFSLITYWRDEAIREQRVIDRQLSAVGVTP